MTKCADRGIGSDRIGSDRGIGSDRIGGSDRGIGSDRIAGQIDARIPEQISTLYF